MLHGKTNKSFHWKSKLDELDHLPGEPQTSKTAAWEKLQARMQEKQGSKKNIWYWMAAASLVMITGLPWLFLNQDRNNLSVRNDQQTSKSSMPVHKHIENSEVITTMSPKASGNGQTGTTATIKTKIPHPAHTEARVKIDLVPAQPDTIKESLSRAPGINSEKIDTNVQIAANPVRKRLRIIHINELGEQVPTFRQDDHSSSVSLSRNASDNIVKIKITPSN